ncbi:MAG TPA: lysine--tRNA ligase [Chroococcales cyanobacterium]
MEQSPALELNERSEQEAIRLKKLEELKACGVEPYPYRFDRTHLASDLQEQYKELANGVETTDVVRVAGRLMGRRESGKLTFIDLVDGSGKVQLFLSLDKLGEKSYELLSLLDLGDFLGAEGTVRRTKRGELSVAVSSWTFLSKALRPLPEKWHGLSDMETRYRQRYLDLMTNPESKKVFLIRSRVVKTIRNFLENLGYIEVETPMLQVVPGGAAARPFNTHHNALDLDLHLRISPELFLKRLVVGGFERVYEINRNFRNEGISTRHNPEFTMVELYQAYADYGDMMKLAEDLFAACALEACGTTSIPFGEEGTPDYRLLDLTAPWPRITMEEAVSNFVGEDTSRMSLAELTKLSEKFEVPLPKEITHGRLINEIFEAKVDSTLFQPVFIIDYPVEVSPLAKKHRHDPLLTERFEIFVAGRELGNAFSELNDPIDQRERFESQLTEREQGNDEAHRIDEDYLCSMEYGLPPTGGMGIGVDRLVMLLANVPSIRDVILFPLLRPRE